MLIETDGGFAFRRVLATRRRKGLCTTKSDPALIVVYHESLKGLSMMGNPYSYRSSFLIILPTLEDRCIAGRVANGRL